MDNPHPSGDREGDARRPPAVRGSTLVPPPGLRGLVRAGGSRGILARRLLPAVILVPVGLGWAALAGARAGLWDETFAIAALVVASVVVLFLLIWQSLRVLRRAEAEQERSLEALQESESRFRALAENASEAIVTIEASDEIVFANPGLERILGYTPEELVGTPFSRLIPERLRARHRQGIERYVRTGERNIPWTGIELPGLTKDGGEVPLEVTFSEYRRGGRHFFTGIMRDVTERKEAAERQRFLVAAGRLLSSSLDLEEVLERVAQLAVPAVADWCAVDLKEEDGSIRRAATAHVDPARAEQVTTLAERFPPPPEASHGAGQVIRTGEPELLREISEAQLQAVSGNEEHLRLLRELGLRSGMVVPMASEGRVTGAITLVTAESDRLYGDDDLALGMQLAALAGIAVQNSRLHRRSDEARAEAERRAREEEALREATSALSATFSTAEVVEQIARSALVATEADGAFVERIDGVGGEVEVVAVAGTDVPEVATRIPYENSVAQRAVERLEPELVGGGHGAGRGFLGDLVARCADCSGMVVPLVDGGEPIGALVLIRRSGRGGFRPDEVERALTFADLAALAFRKVHILEESERRREELERVSESRARLMRGFSHDVKNPLGAADGYAALLLEGVLGEVSEAQRETVERLRRALRSALSLIEDLVELARAEAGQVEIRAAPTDLREALQEVAEGYRARAEAKGLTLEVELPDRLPIVDSDPERVRQILGNLVSNAVKYTERGRVRVGVVTRERRGEEWIVVEVEDTGRGIPKEQQGRLFQEFSRLEPDREEGAGLGLAIAQQIAHALDGEISVDSEPGRGSTFAFWHRRRALAERDEVDDGGSGPPRERGSEPQVR